MLTLTYKDYTAETDFDWVRLCWVGHVVTTEDLGGFHGATIEEAEQHFHKAVDAYLATFKEVGGRVAAERDPNVFPQPGLLLCGTALSYSQVRQ